MSSASRPNTAPEQPLRRYRQLVATSETEAHEIALSGFPGLYEFSFVDREERLLSSAMVTLGEIYISTVRSSGHNIWLADDDRIAVLFPCTGTIEVARHRVARRAQAGDTLVVGVGERRTRLSSGYFGTLIKLPRNLVQQRIEKQVDDISGVSLDGPGPPACAALSASVRRHAQLLIGELDSSDWLLSASTARASASRMLADLVAACWIKGANPDLPAIDAGSGKVKRAQAFMRANAHRPITVTDVAEAMGCSMRALQVAFQRHRETTPHAFLTECRLLLARRLLTSASPEGTVSQLLAMAGAAHHGRFSAQYKLRFGELPSTSLRRAQFKPD